MKIQKPLDAYGENTPLFDIGTANAVKNECATNQSVPSRPVVSGFHPASPAGDSSPLRPRSGLENPKPMADWFKFYENDLSEERLRWAMSEQQQVGIVYVTILSRCCRDKTDTLPWHGEDFELFALAQQCFISPPIANQCLGLLCKINYVEMGEGFFRVVRWSERQSEYCKKKQKVVPTVSGHSPDSVCLEESRGDERREDKHSQKAIQPLSQKELAEAIYALYPRKVGKPDALRAILSQLKGNPFDLLHNATQKLKELWAGHDLTYLPYPATWFNQQRFNDDPSTWGPKVAPVNGLPPKKSLIEQELDAMDRQIERIRQ